MALRTGFFLLLLSILCSFQAYSQKVLALENPARFKRIIFKPGDYIRFGTDDSQARFSGTIESIDDSVVVIVKVVTVENEGDATNNVFRDYVPIREITKVYNPDQGWWYYFRNMYSGTAMIGGGVLILGSIFNSWVLDSPPDPSSIILASSIYASGLIVRYLGRNKYKIGKRWKLRAMEPIVEKVVQHEE